MPQALSPEEIRKATFHVTMRGYARDEVDEYLNGIAKLVAQLTEKAETAYLNLGVRMGELLQEAKDAADELQAKARADATRMVEEARSSADETTRSANEQAASTIQTAESHAAKIVAEAEERVDEMTQAEQSIRADLGQVRAQLESLTQRLTPLTTSVTAPPAPPMDIVDEGPNGHREIALDLEVRNDPIGMGSE